MSQRDDDLAALRRYDQNDAYREFLIYIAAVAGALGTAIGFVGGFIYAIARYL